VNRRHEARRADSIAEGQQKVTVKDFPKQQENGSGPAPEAAEETPEAAAEAGEPAEAVAEAEAEEPTAAVEAEAEAEVEVGAPESVDVPAEETPEVEQ